MFGFIHGLLKIPFQVARAASPPDGGEGMQNNDPPPLQGDSFSPASPEGEQGQPDYNSTPYPLSGKLNPSKKLIRFISYSF